MKKAEVSEATVIAEYQAIRAEILLRLGFQQQLLNLSLISIGFIVPISGLFGVKAVDSRGVLALLFIGPIVSVFLQLIYLKHFIYIQQLASYIANGLGSVQALDTSLPKNVIPVFSGWEKHLNSKLIKPPQVDLALGVIGGAEAAFPSIAGVLYLVVFIAAGLIQVSKPSSTTFLVLGAVFDGFLLLAVLLIIWVVRTRQHDLRIKVEESAP